MSKEEKVYEDKTNKIIKKETRKAYIVTILILLSIVLIAFISIVKSTVDNEKMGYVSLKPIDVTLSSDEGNHKLFVKITLGGKSKNLNKLNMENAQLIAKETVKQLEYKHIIEEGGNDYIKNVLLNVLREKLDKDIEQVNLDSILADITINDNISQNQSNSGVSKTEEYLKGFSWTKKK